jgi:beta-glucosidase
LSYTTFEYHNPRVSSQTFQDADGLSVSVDVTNTGKMAGKEIIQVYVHDHKSSLARPPKELKGFAKVELLPGETKTVTVTLDFRAFAYYHPAYRQWITEDGEFDILIGASSSDIRCTKTVTLISTLDLPSILNRESTFSEWAEDPRGVSVLGPMYQQMIDQMRVRFGDADHEALGMDPKGFMMEMPLAGVLNFLAIPVPATPEETVDELLARVYSTD